MRRTYFFVILSLMLMVSAGAAWAERRVVVSELVPICGRPGGKEIASLVYGNIVDISPAKKGDAPEGWAVIKSGDASLYVETAGLAPLPKYTSQKAEPYIAVDDEPDLRLLPGDAGSELSLAKHGFMLLRGEVVQCLGSMMDGSEKWLLLRSSSDASSGGSAGVGHRWAWAPASAFRPLSSYDPATANGSQWIPFRMRTADGAIEIPSGSRDALFAQGFAIDGSAPSDGELCISELYRRSSDRAAFFITTDLFLHSFRMMEASVLAEAERDVLTPRLAAALSTALSAFDRAEKLQGFGRATAIARDSLTIPLFLLGRLDASALSENAAQTAQKIVAASGISVSPMTGETEDWTLYSPRGRWAGDDALERWYRAIAFLSRTSMSLFEPDGKPFGRHAAAAAFICLSLEEAGDDWTGVIAPLDFLMGRTAEGSFAQSLAVIKKHVPTLADVRRLTDTRVLDAISIELRDSRAASRANERISADESSVFRIAGRRFELDSYIFGMLVSPRVGSTESPRPLPETADLMAALGAPAASIATERSYTIENYANTIVVLRDEAARMIAPAGDLPTAELALAASCASASSGAQVPASSPEWSARKLASACAAYAELRGRALQAGSPPEEEQPPSAQTAAAAIAPPEPRGYIEAEPQTYALLAKACSALRAAFEKYSLDTEEAASIKRSDEFRSLCRTAERIAEAELAGKALSSADYAAISSLARAFAPELLDPRGNASACAPSIVQLAVDRASGTALFAATGAPQEIIVFVNDASGGPRAARGWVSSFRELTRTPGADEPSDEDLQAMLIDPESSKELAPSWLRDDAAQE